MGRGDHIGPPLVDRGVDDERTPVDRPGALDNDAVAIDKDQIADADPAEGNAERVDPEYAGIGRVADRDVPGDALVVAEPAEHPQSGGELLLAVPTFIVDGLEVRCGRNAQRAVGHVCPPPGSMITA